MTEQKPLPQGWTWTTLGEVVALNPRVSIGQLNDEDSVSFVGMAAVEAESGRMDASQARQLKDVKRGYTGFLEGDVLFAKITPCMENGKSAVARNLVGGIGFGSTEFHVLRGEEGINSDLIRYFVGQRSFRGEARANMTGSAGQLRVPTNFLENAPFPLAPIEEQKRIADRLDALFSELDAGLDAIEKAKGKLKSFRASVLRAATSGELSAGWRAENAVTESGSVLLKRILLERRLAWEEKEGAKRAAKSPGKKLFEDDSWKGKYSPPQAPDTSDLPMLPESWCWATVEQLAAPVSNAITDGPFGSNLKTEHYTEDGPRVIRLQNIGDGEFFDAQAHIDEERFARLSKHRIFAGDIVIAGMGERPPRSCIIPSHVGPAIVKADCIRFQTSPAINANFVNFTLNAEPTRARTSELIHGVGRPRLNLSEIKSIILPLPPIEEQEWIAGEVEQRLALATETEKALDAAQKRAQSLKAGILRRAFRGELSEQDPDEESAETLLETIRLARIEALAEAKKVRKLKSPKMPKNTSKNQRSLFDVLHEAGGELTPEKLFQTANYAPETVDEFYAELRDEVDEKRIEQVRGKSPVVLRALAPVDDELEEAA